MRKRGDGDDKRQSELDKLEDLIRRIDEKIIVGSWLRKN